MKVYITYYPTIVSYMYFSAIKNITLGSVIDKTDQTSDNDYLCPLNVFCLDKCFQYSQNERKM